MLKPTTAIMTAAAIAAAFTLLSSPAPVGAGPLAKQAVAEIDACAQRAWPYLRCVGTPLGNPNIRLITIDRVFGGQ